MKELGYGKGYKYAPNSTEEEIDKQKHLPDELEGREYYTEVDERKE